MDAESRFASLGVTNLAPPAPVGSYVPAQRSGDLVFLSGHGPMLPDGTFVTGKVGRDLDLDGGRKAARLAGIALLCTLRAELGALTRVTSVVKLVGMVNTIPGFTEIPKVLDGCSELLIEVFGEPGRHARSAIGVAELPLGISVEMDVVVAVNGA